MAVSSVNRIQGERVRWQHRIQPYVGSLILLMGIVTSGLALLAGKDGVNLRALGTGLLMSLASLGLIHRRTGIRPQFWFFSGGAMTAGFALIYFLI